MSNSTQHTTQRTTKIELQGIKELDIAQEDITQEVIAFLP